MGAIDYVQHFGSAIRCSKRCQEEQQHLHAVHILSGHVDGGYNIGPRHHISDDGRCLGVSLLNRHLDIIFVELSAVAGLHGHLLFLQAKVSGWL